ncbi:hypothetical protein [Methylovulum psychrotolerans]|uniref:Uncharacterized protein n=1 Tax=Methylovulum psychrotolerans TaxID=1704499 RepID=A0A2S5CP00_9GAMM|nr:hypothetical protein [Methylovulum psychrotolerans]POZ52524.1 hypothetical protein AADEFJLK_02008 [Methylovulum psychrotolerans]
MAYKKLLHLLIIGEFASILLAIFIAFQFPQLLPPALQDYLATEAFSGGLLIMALLLLLGLIVSYIGLWRTKPWGRLLYTATALGMEFVSFNSATIMSGLETVFNDLFLISMGGILTLIWATELRHDFVAADTSSDG